MDEVHSAVNAALNVFGRIDVLVNNAGYGLVGALGEYSEDQMRQNIETNLFGAINMSRAVLPTMRSQYAYSKFRQKIDSFTAELDAWEAIASNTDFETETTAH